MINLEVTTYRRNECAAFMRSRDRHGDLSNMTSGFPLIVNTVRFQGPEGLYQALKFPHRPEHQLHIAHQPSGMAAKRAAYELDDTRADWDQVRVIAMICTQARKLAQHRGRFAAALLETGDLPIVEMSRRDPFWGAVPDGDTRQAATLTGLNALGKVLTALRDELAADPVNPLEVAQKFWEKHYAETGVEMLVNQKPFNLNLVKLADATSGRHQRC